MNGAFYCRTHEDAHLRVTDEAERLNLARLGQLLSGDERGCWLWTGPVNDGGYGTFVPEGANTAKWIAHRVVWDLLVGGHKPRLELDHRTCKRPGCANPSHLEPVTKSVNQKRKRHAPEWGWTNPTASSNPRVAEFAANHGLPMQALTLSAGRSPNAVLRRPTTRKKSCHDRPPRKSIAPRSGTKRVPITGVSGYAHAAHHRRLTATRMDLGT